MKCRYPVFTLNCTYLLFSSYQWRSVNCAENHEFVCSAFVPDCPAGYSYRPWISSVNGVPSDACYKVATSGAAKYGDKMYENFCRNALTLLYIFSLASKGTIP